MDFAIEGGGTLVDLKVALLSLGCSKNLVDSEVLLARLAEAGIALTPRPEDAQVVVVNTCAFIGDAREESIDTLLEMAALKEEGRVRAVLAVGCLPQRHGEELARSLPEVDAFLPISDYSRIGEVVRTLASGGSPEGGDSLCGGRPKGPGADLDRLLLTPPSYAYLRVAEGCDHKCSFCAIPLIRGRLRSKPREVLLEEARRLAALGVKELNLVAEDTTAWGRDLGDREGLAGLLRDLDRVEGIRWIRILYGYPWSVTPALLEAMAGLEKVLPYLDLPIQHFSSPVLEAMKRGAGAGKLRDLLFRIRREVPGVVLRTTVLVGHPRETDRRFRELMDFLAEFRFERLGAFAFSPEEGTPSAAMGGRPSRKTARARLEEVMRLNRQIMAERNRALLGGTVEVLVDRALEDGTFLGRTAADAPEVDGTVRIRSSRPLAEGDIVRIRVTGFEDYDLEGEVLPGGAP